MSSKVIPDKSLIKIPVKDIGEKLVNLKIYCPGIIIDIEPQSKKIQQLPRNTCYVRRRVAEKLCKTQKLLPKNYYLMIWDGHRPLNVQKKRCILIYIIN